MAEKLGGDVKILMGMVENTGFFNDVYLPKSQYAAGCSDDLAFFQYQRNRRSMV